MSSYHHRHCCFGYPPFLFFVANIIIGWMILLPTITTDAVSAGFVFSSFHHRLDEKDSDDSHSRIIKQRKQRSMSSSSSFISWRIMNHQNYPLRLASNSKNTPSWDPVDSLASFFFLGMSKEDETKRAEMENPVKELFYFDDLFSLSEGGPTISDDDIMNGDDTKKHAAAALERSRESLINFLQLWARQLEADPSQHNLATPVMIKDFQEMVVLDEAKPIIEEKDNDDDDNDNETVLCIQENDEQDDTPSSSISSLSTCTDSKITPDTPDTGSSGTSSYSMKLIFRPPKRYLSYKEQRGMEKGVLPDRKGAKVDAWSAGGVELIVTTTAPPASNCKSSDRDDFNDGTITTLLRQQQPRTKDDPLWSATTTSDSSSSSQEGGGGEREHLTMSLQARRCDIDGDTIIKYSTEQTIIRRLKEAIRIWKKVRAMK